jgi:ABC-type sugar transport system permease subunit
MAGLQRIDPELYEAASIDGASWGRRLTAITLPLIRPELYVVVLTTMIYSLKTFGPIFAMTKGGPGNATMVASYFSYKNFFEGSNVGYGSTMATVLTAVIIVITIVYVRVQTQQEQREAL